VIPDGVTLRPATRDDAVAGAALHRACWRETYGPHVDPAVLEARLADPIGWIAAWERQLAVGPPRTLAVADDELVGFSVSGPSRDEEAPAPWELYAIYVRQAWWGSGLGDELMTATVPDGPCWLFVLEANARAQAFYRRHGFAPDGTRHHYAGLDAWELRMVRP
jgi:ribosomal protein S18 acetylase RimI-like enzyme